MKHHTTFTPEEKDKLWEAGVFGTTHPQALQNAAFLCWNQPLSAFQWGFLEGRSTVTALLHLTDQWLQALEVGHDVCAVFFNFRKAFDSVPHLTLDEKATCSWAS